MSWIDNLSQVIFTITTGDNEVYTPKWKNATKDVEYNVSLFEFVNVEGTLAIRKKPKGRKFELEFYFDGEDCIEIGEKFEKSARDSKNWTVKHPFYGNFQCQPLSLKQNNSNYNTTQFIVSVTETITKVYPEQNVIIVDKIMALAEEVQEEQAAAVEEVSTEAAEREISLLEKLYTKGLALAKDIQAMKQLVNDAVNRVNNAISTATSIVRGVQSLANYPAMVLQSVTDRFNVLTEAFDGLIDTFDGSESSRQQTEASLGTIIASMQVASVTNITTDYDLRTNIDKQKTNLIDAYNRYLLFLESLQTERTDSINSYTPNFNGLNKINELVNYTIASLDELINESKQEREFTLDADSNIILLTHRFYGLDNEDLNIVKLMNQNNIQLNEILNIPKGRKILYYV